MIFTVIVCASHKEPVAVTDFDRLYLKNSFELLEICKKHLVACIKLFKIKSSYEKSDLPPHLNSLFVALY